MIMRLGMTREARSLRRRQTRTRKTDDARPRVTAPPAVSNVRAHAGDVGVSRDNAYNGQDLDEPAPKNSLWRILTCRCG